ncbi:MAG: alpha/beta fold hydrolase [Sphingopyxis sp.]
MIKPSPRPLPLFLELVRRVTQSDPDTARRALAGMRIYADTPRTSRPHRRMAARVGRVQLLAGEGESGPAVVLVPSLINPSHVLDLAPGNSLIDHLSLSGMRPYLLDWGHPCRDDSFETIGDHITQYLLPMLHHFDEPVHLLGYCLGGTMALAAAALTPVRSLVLLATPWHFRRYGDEARTAMREHWQAQHQAVDAMGLMPVEMLQSLFWALDPDRTIAKYASLADLAPDDRRAIVFAALEDWANSGSPITAAAAAELFDDLIGADVSGAGAWQVGGSAIAPSRITAPSIHFTAQGDRIAPAETAPDGIKCHPCPSGHVGMVVGKAARTGLWNPLADWLRNH